MKNDLSVFANAGVPATLDELTTGLDVVQTNNDVSAGGGTYLRLLRDGGWVYGAESIEVEDGSLWAVNPYSVTHGWVAWADQKSRSKTKKLGEIVRAMNEPPVLESELPEVGAEWRKQVGFTALCTSGEDDGLQVLYQTPSDGGTKAHKKLVAEILRRAKAKNEFIMPKIALDTDFYAHPDYGKIYKPVFTVVEWCDMDGEPEGGAAEVADEPEAVEEAPKRTRGKRKSAA